MFFFFQVLFTVVAPVQDAVEGFFARLGGLSVKFIPGAFGRFVNEALINGVGAMTVFLPPVALLFLMISLEPGTRHLTRRSRLEFTSSPAN